KKPALGWNSFSTLQVRRHHAYGSLAVHRCGPVVRWWTSFLARLLDFSWQFRFANTAASSHVLHHTDSTRWSRSTARYRRFARTVRSQLVASDFAIPADQFSVYHFLDLQTQDT